MTERSTNKPIKVLRIGAISASVFENASKEGDSFHRISFARAYRVNDQTKISTSFGVNDLLAVGNLALEAFEFARNLESESDSDK